MKAVQINKFGGNEVLEIVDVGKPVVSPERVLVKVHAASINRFDLKLRSGVMPQTFPITLGGDFAGVIEEVGEGVEGVRKGDEVFGQALIINGGSGSFAEYATTKPSMVANKPKKANFVTSAALPLVGVSAVQALTEHIKLASRQKIFIQGGAGGIGHIAIQIAKAIGAHVATAVSTDDVEFAKSLGADEVIDYKMQEFETILKDYDAAFVTGGASNADKVFSILKKGGVLVSMIDEFPLSLGEKYGVTAIGQNTKVTSERLQKLATFVETGKVTVSVAKIFPLEKVQEAANFQEQNHPRGKVVLQIIA